MKRGYEPLTKEECPDPYERGFLDGVEWLRVQFLKRNWVELLRWWWCSRREAP